MVQARTQSGCLPYAHGGIMTCRGQVLTIGGPCDISDVVSVAAINENGAPSRLALPLYKYSRILAWYVTHVNLEKAVGATEEPGDTNGCREAQNYLPPLFRAVLRATLSRRVL